MDIDCFDEWVREGRESFENKIPLSDCPYIESGDRSMGWERGWDMARMDQIRSGNFYANNKWCN